MSDTGQVFPERVAKVQSLCEKSNKRFEFAFLLDAFAEEQGQGITIDKTETAWSWQGRNFLFIDTPGHKEFLKNMISGASTADVALIMLDAQEGIREQFHRHAAIIKTLGIPQVLVVVNKMDLVDYFSTRFEILKLEIQKIVRPDAVIPLVAFLGENLLVKSAQMSWDQGPTLAQALMATKPRLTVNAPLRFSLQDVYKFDERRIYAGQVESGTLKVGDSLHFLPSGSSTKVKTIESWSTPEAVAKVEALSAVGCTLDDPLFLERAELVTKQRRGREQRVLPNLETVRHAARVLEQIEMLWRERLDRFADVLTAD